MKAANAGDVKSIAVWKVKTYQSPRLALSMLIEFCHLPASEARAEDSQHTAFV